MTEKEFSEDKETMEAYNFAIGKIIKNIGLFLSDNEDEDRLIINFIDNTGIKIFDDGHMCCEHRNMTCDDDLTSFIGSQLISIKIKKGKTTENDDYYHQTQFLEIMTTNGCFQCVNHNKHNGYYAGFDLAIEII